MDRTFPVTSISSFPRSQGTTVRVLLAGSVGMVLGAGGVRVTQVEETGVLVTSLDTPRSSSSQSNISLKGPALGMALTDIY